MRNPFGIGFRKAALARDHPWGSITRLRSKELRRAGEDEDDDEEEGNIKLIRFGPVGWTLPGRFDNYKGEVVRSTIQALSLIEMAPVPAPGELAPVFPCTGTLVAVSSHFLISAWLSAKEKPQAQLW